MGRVKHNISPVQAEVSLTTIWRNAIQSTNSPSNTSAPDRIVLESGAVGFSDLRARFRQPLYILFVLTIVIMLVGCFNVASLLVTRSLSRQQELAVRLSVGAKRARLVRQFLTESALLVALGLVCGVAVYQGCIHGILGLLVSGGEQIYLNMSIDLRVAGFAIGLAGLTIVAFGVFPAFRATAHHATFNPALTPDADGRAVKLGRVTLVAQLGLSLTLAATAALLAHSFHELRTFDAGFRRDHLIVASVDFPDETGQDTGQRRVMHDYLRGVRSLPGVRSASWSNIFPMCGSSASPVDDCRFFANGRIGHRGVSECRQPRVFSDRRDYVVSGARL